MRASRLVSILLLLQTRGRLTAQQLADTLEVSVRTIYRDVESLHDAGIPLYGEAGHAGGYQLVDGYRTRLTGLSADEAETLFLAGLPKAAAELGLGGALAAAQLKLQAGEATIRLSPEGRRRMRELMSSAVIEATDRTAGATGNDGWVTAVVPIESLEHAESEFLRLGANVQILAPDGLRRRMQQTARSLAALYPVQ
jgi:predicted DNA-binding transcriptional regulator YafY